MAGNGFPERWQQQTNWTIAETGFGTGLNFLCCWQQWQQHAAENSRLTFISAEKHPVSVDELRSTLQQWDELAPFAEELIAQWPSAVGGFHSLSFDEGRVSLLLLFGDCTHCYSQLDAPIDAWFLDGFTPSRNPGMWQEELFVEIARLSKPGTTFATFTAAGFVRRGLIDVGFSASKRKGYRHKRDMVVGHIPQEQPSDELPLPKAKKVAVVGGGLAGCSAAYSLARRGVKVDLYESTGALAAGASGVPAAVTRPFPDLSLSPAARLSIDGFSYTRQLLARLGLADSQGAYWANDDQWCDLPAEFAEAKSANDFCTKPGLLIPAAQTTNVEALCNCLSSHSNIKTHLNTNVSGLKLSGENWLLTSNSETKSYDNVVLCTGAVAEELLSDQSKLDSRAIRGQLSGYAGEQNLKNIICGNGHIARHEGTTWIGASFVPGDIQRDIRDRDREVYEAKVSELTGGRSESFHASPRVDWAGIRNTTADHLPLAGQLADNDRLEQIYARDKPRRGKDIDDSCRVNGLYVSLAHGSRGTVTAPICGEMIAAAISGDACPLPIPVRRAIDPARQAVKALRQQ